MTQMKEFDVQIKVSFGISITVDAVDEKDAKIRVLKMIDDHELMSGSDLMEELGDRVYDHGEWYKITDVEEIGEYEEVNKGE